MWEEEEFVLILKADIKVKDNKEKYKMCGEKAEHVSLKKKNSHMK